MAKFLLIGFAVIALCCAEIPGTEYLPPIHDISLGNEYLAPIDASYGGELADDGYRYRTVKRLRHRQRRGVSELVSGEYLPPIHEGFHGIPTNEYIAPIDASYGGELADDGYRYRTVKRLRHRQRRGVSEIVSGEYLPPIHEGIPTNEYLAPIDASYGGELAVDGYRYKTVRKIKRLH